jgi:hypothetical protein
VFDWNEQNFHSFSLSSFASEMYSPHKTFRTLKLKFMSLKVFLSFSHIFEINKSLNELIIPEFSTRRFYFTFFSSKKQHGRKTKSSRAHSFICKLSWGQARRTLKRCRQTISLCIIYSNIIMHITSPGLKHDDGVCEHKKTESQRKILMMMTPPCS